jgi:sirohydrochlorin cobaltochelatase
MSNRTMRANESDRWSLERLEHRLRTILPEQYQESYEQLEPVPMRSAGLKFDDDGRVAWDEIWGSFCELAMAGGPPHKGTLLGPGTAEEVGAQPDQHRYVVQEICRGVTMVADLFAHPSPTPGWVRVSCFTETMAAWLLRAIIMENVSARAGGKALEVPAAPGFLLEREIKNVITVIAKTCHYWTGHMPRDQQRAIAELFGQMAVESPLVEPALASDAAADAGYEETATNLATAIARDAGLQRSNHRYVGWLGLDCPGVHAAVWMMRALVASNVLSRREGHVLFVPVDPRSDPGGVRTMRAVALVRRLAASKGVF